MYVGPVRMRTYLTCGQYCEAVALGEAPNVFVTVGEETTEEDGEKDAVILPEPERDGDTVNEPVFDVEPLRLPDMVPDGVKDVDILPDDEAPKDSDTVDDDV